jgi:hypothetical protein
MPSFCLTKGGRDQIGMVAAIKSEQWPGSDRNTWPSCAGIRTAPSASGWSESLPARISTGESSAPWQGTHTNSVERAMRPVALSRKNSLFSGSDEGAENWACLASLVETCKLNRVNPQIYFTELLTRFVNGWPQKRIDELMPWNLVPQQPS